MDKKNPLEEMWYQLFCELDTEQNLKSLFIHLNNGGIIVITDTKRLSNCGIHKGYLSISGAKIIYEDNVNSRFNIRTTMLEKFKEKEANFLVPLSSISAVNYYQEES